ncbi:uncharacterized protein ACMZJ9_017550 isoform 2-T2 [Mantella aurantiaca]
MMSPIQASLSGLLLCLLTLMITTLEAMQTTTPQKVEKPGHCPPERFSTSEFPRAFCQNDGDCCGKQKCCEDNGFKICKPPAAIHPGSCPAPISVPYTKERCDDECTADSDCAQGAKCCFHDCGLRCLPLKGEKKGFCPSEVQILCIRAERTFCFSDTGCPDDEKCCPYTCADRCQKPLSERNGNCPTNVKTVPTGPKCKSDYDCAKLHKCCQTKKGKKCLPAENN